MASHMNPNPLIPALPSSSPHNQTNTIDLTLDDDSETSTNFNSHTPSRHAKRPRTENAPIYPSGPGGRLIAWNGGGIPNPIQPASTLGSVNEQLSTPNSSAFHGPPTYQQPLPAFQPNPYRPVFAGQPSSTISPVLPWQPAPTASSSQSTPPFVTKPPSDRQVIDLTGSPSPPPNPQIGLASIPSLGDLSPKTPVCIGLLTVTALVLYPVPYLYSQQPNSIEAEWAPVRLHYEHSPNKPGGSETIHIKTPHSRGLSGEVLEGEDFGVVEQKVATSLGPMLGKGLIRLDAKVRKGLPNVSMAGSLLSPVVTVRP